MPEPFAFRSSRLDLAGWTWGASSLPPLLLIHGGRDHARSWDRVAEALADRHHVVAPDLRGHGRSAWASDGAYDMADFVLDLAAVTDRLGHDRVDLVGHSLGGNVAWRYAALWPARVRRLVVIEGLGPSFERQAAIDATPIAELLRADVEARQRERAARVYPDLAAAEARLRREMPGFAPDLIRHLARYGVREVDGGFVFASDPGLRAWTSADLTIAERQALWRAIEAPVLLVYGRDSWASDPATDGRAEAFRDAQTLLIEGAGHWVHHDRPEAFIAAVRGFLGEGLAG